MLATSIQNVSVSSAQSSNICSAGTTRQCLSNAADLLHPHKRSRGVVAAAEYEVDFITYFTKLAGLGAQFDNNKYLYPITLELPKIK